MSDPKRHVELEAESLLAFGDRIARGQAAAPESALEEVALRVHRALRLPAPRQSAMPRALKTAVWEEIMHSTTLSAAQPRRSSGFGRAAHWRPAPSMNRAWMVAANMGLVLAIVLAGFAAWRTLGDGGEETGNPGIALQAATPEAATVTPAATDSGVGGCALDRDIPIIPQVAPDQELPRMTYLAIRQYDRMAFDNLRGDLVLGCPGEEPVVLAANVYSAGPGPWPGTVQASILPWEMEQVAPMPTEYIEIASGRSVTFAPADTASMQGLASGSPWVVGTSMDPNGELLLVDLRTMETRPLQDVFGVEVPANAAIFFSTPSEDGTVLAGFRQPYGEAAFAGTVITDLDAPGDLVRLGTSFDDIRWLTLPETVIGVSAVTLSPDGSLAVATSMGEAGMLANTQTNTLLNTANGEIVAQSGEIERGSEPFALWVGDGSTAVYVDGSTVRTLSAAGDDAVFDAAGNLGALSVTRDPNVVTVSTAIDRGSDAGGEQAGTDAVYAVNVVTGESREFLGLDASNNASWLTETGALVMYEWSDEIIEETTYQVYDPVTGDQIGTINGAPAVQPFERMRPTLGPNSVAFSSDGAVEVIALGTSHIYAFVLEGGQMQMRRIEAPEGLLSEVFLTAEIAVSPDGGSLSIFGQEDEGRTRYVISLDDPDAGWTRIENTVVASGGGQIGFAAVATD